MFGDAGREHMEKYGSEPDHFAWIGWKNHKHSVNNPYAQFQDEYTLEEIKAARDDPRAADQAAVLADVRRRGRAIVASERFVDEHGLWDQAIEIAGQAMTTDCASTFDDDTDCIKIVGYDMSQGGRATAPTRRPASAPDDVDVCELHDCFSRQRADHLRGARASPPRARATSSSRPRRRPTAATARWSTRPAA